MNGNSLCSGRVEVKSNQSWVSVCEGDFDQQDAEVVCRELGCGAPSVLQGALYGEMNASMWTKEFQCEGNESALLNCTTSDSTNNSCSLDKTVELTCTGNNSKTNNLYLYSKRFIHAGTGRGSTLGVDCTPVLLSQVVRLVC